MEIDQEILDEFHTEAEESLDALEQDLIKLEAIAEEGGSDPELIDRIFRVLHTLKGGAGFLGLDKMNRLAHSGENLLDEVRSEKVPVTTDVMDALLETNDTLKDLLDCSKKGEDPDSIDFKPLADRLDKLAVPGDIKTEDAAVIADDSKEPVEEPTDKEKSVAEEDTQPTGEVEVDAELLAEITNDDRLSGPAAEDDDEVAASTGEVEVDAELLAEITNDDRLSGPAAEDDDEVAASTGEVEVDAELLAEITNDDRLSGPAAEDDDEVAASTEEVEVDAELLAEITNDDRLDGSAAEDDENEVEVVEAEKVESVKAEDKDTKKEDKKADAFERRDDDRRAIAPDRRKKPGRRDGDPQEVTIRVDTSRLDAVMNLVGELVLARNSLVRQLEREEVRDRLKGCEHTGAIDTNLEAVTRVSKDLQMSVLRTRMQPIKRVFDKIPRQVRELKNRLNKEINLVIEGEGTEVDRSLVEELADPMVHLIRNALDHGLEEGPEREEMGKNAAGTLTVRAFYEGNNVVIQVQDDGRGIDVDRVKAKAIERGILNAESAAKMSDIEAQRLIMAAGFSTAEQVSDVSGRGVGMDVVNDKIGKMKGTIELTSEFGVGTTVSIYLPLTLAIVQALIVEANDEGFAIPIGTISEVIKFRPSECHKVNEEDAIELRGEVLPIKYLGEITRKGTRVYGVSEDITAEAPKVVEGIKEDSEEHNEEAVETEEVAAAADTAAAKTAAKTTAKDKAKAKEAKDSKSIMDQDADSDGYVIVVRDGSLSVGLVIDELIGQEEAVVKSITKAFEFNPAISGATISGDGKVHMILDVPYLMREFVEKQRLLAIKNG